MYRLLRNRRNFLIASKLFLAGLPTLVVEALARNDSKVFKLLSAYKYGPVTAYNTPTLRHRIMTKRACFSFPRLNPSFTLAEALYKKKKNVLAKKVFSLIELPKVSRWISF